MVIIVFNNWFIFSVLRDNYTYLYAKFYLMLARVINGNTVDASRERGQISRYRIMTRVGDKNRRMWFDVVILFSSKTSIPALTSMQPLIQWGAGVFSGGNIAGTCI